MRRPLFDAARCALLALAVPACASSPLQLPFDGGPADLTSAPDLGTTDLATTTAPIDLAVADAPVCVPPVDDGGAAACPCGAAGLCRPATGRVLAQTATQDGTLRILVMDDNGCHQAAVSADLPLSGPRWADDHERLAFVSANGQTSVLHIVRVSPSGAVLCSSALDVGSTLKITDVAWAASDALWLFSRATGALVRFTLDANGTETDQQSIPSAQRFDAVGDGPLAIVEQQCAAQCTSQVLERPQVASGMLQTVAQPGDVIGGVRLDHGSQRLVYELDAQSSGAFLLDFSAPGAMPVPTAEPGARAPSFALGGHAILYTTDAGALRYALLDGPQAGTVLDIPPAWANVYTPEWTALPSSCNTPTTCP